MSSTCINISSFLDCSYSGSQNDWPWFILNFNVTLSKRSYMTFFSKLLLLFRPSACPHGIFEKTGKKQSFLKSLLTLSEKDLHVPTYLNKTLYCHLSENFCNKYTNLHRPWQEWHILGLCCIKHVRLYTIAFLWTFNLYNSIQFLLFTVFIVCWKLLFLSYSSTV